MLQLHENTQRRIGLVCFALLCVAPTVFVLGWIVSLRLPSHRHDLQRRLSHLVGMDVRMSSVKHPKPGVTAMEDLEIRTAEGGELILKSAEVRAYFPWNGNVILAADTAQTNANQYGAVEELFARLLARKVKPDEFHVRVNVERLTVNLGEEKTFQLADVRGIVASEPAQSQTHWNFHLEDDVEGSPLRVSFKRQRDDRPASTMLGVDTGDGSVSCELLGLGFEWMRGFGVARFQGTVQVESDGGGRQTQCRGVWRGLNLDTLLEERRTAALGGQANLSLTYARFSNGRLAEATGVLVAGPGSVERGFMEAMAFSYDLDFAADTSDPSASIPYTWLDVDFRIENGSFVMKGRSGDVIMQGPRGEVLLTSRSQPLPIDALRFPGLFIPVVEVESTARRP